MKNKLICIAVSLVVTAVFSATAAQSLNSPSHFLATTPILERGVPAFGTLSQDDGQNFKDGSYLDLYTFSGVAGEELTLQLGSNDFDTFLSVFGPTGELYDWNDDDWDMVSSEYGYNSVLQLYLAESGRYTVVASGYSAWDLGSYRLLLESVERPGTSARDFSDAELLTVPGSLAATISADLPATQDGFGGPSRVYRFVLDEDLLLVFNASAETVDTVLLLYSADGELLDYNDDHFDASYEASDVYVWQSRLQADLPAGEYYLVLGSFSEYDAGAVDLSVDAYRPVR